VNIYLSKRKPPVKLNDIIDDFQAGPEKMAQLLEILCHCKIDMEGGKLPGHKAGSIDTIKNIQNQLYHEKL
jgi:hypothetical protein